MVVVCVVEPWIARTSWVFEVKAVLSQQHKNKTWSRNFPWFDTRFVG
jgi:hypothetical protein